MSPPLTPPGFFITLNREISEIAQKRNRPWKKPTIGS